VTRDLKRPPEQTWTAESYAGNAPFVPTLGATILEWLDARPGERILDLGCGDGALTVAISQAGATVLGVDTSEALLAAAKERGLDVRRMDGETLTFTEAFDAVFSNAALHWMTQAREVALGIARALVPGGRFVAEFGGHGNIAAIGTALRAVARAHDLDPLVAGTWFNPTAEEYQNLLERCGFAVERIELVPRPTPLPTGIRGWVTTFCRPLFTVTPTEAHDELLTELEDLLGPALCNQSGEWTADYVRLRVRAHRVA